MRIIRTHILTCLILLFSQKATSQDIICDTIYNPYFTAIWKVTPTDTFAIATLAPVVVGNVCTNRQKKRQSDKLEAKVAKVYPYAKVAGDVMKQYDAMLSQITDPKDQKKLIDQAEAQMKSQFEKDLRNMTVSEGVLLIKLIDRETGNTSYRLVQELRGKMSAFMWQGVARLFGHNLKEEYQPSGRDANIENIVQRIEDGTIPVIYRQASAFALSTQE